MSEAPHPCQCGATPQVYEIGGSLFRLRAFGCEACRVTGPARPTTDEALQQWNAGHRVDRYGDRICECCRT